MTNSRRISYVMMVALLVLIGWFHLGVLVLTAFFGFFALEKFSFGRSKILGLIIYLVVVVGIGCGLVVFSHRALQGVAGNCGAHDSRRGGIRGKKGN